MCYEIKHNGGLVEVPQIRTLGLNSAESEGFRCSTGRVRRTCWITPAKLRVGSQKEVMTAQQ